MMHQQEEDEEEDKGCSRYNTEQSEYALCITLGDQHWKIHKCCIGKSGYFKKLLSKHQKTSEDQDITTHELPRDFPGGVQALSLVIDFCLTSNLSINSSNVAALRCAAEFLQMKDLVQKTEAYLTEVVFHSWLDTLMLLHKSQLLLPLAESISLISRSIDVITSMAVSCDYVTSADWWIEDVVELPITYLKRVVRNLRRKGMPEIYVSSLIVRCTDCWLFGKRDEISAGDDRRELTREDGDEEIAAACIVDKVILLENIVSMLPFDKAMPVNFLFLLLRYTFATQANHECRLQIEMRISLQLENATLEDFPAPFESEKSEAARRSVDFTVLDSMKQIISRFLSQHRSFPRSSDDNDPLLTKSSFDEHEAFARVAKVWDEYLGEISSHVGIGVALFTELVEILPAYARNSHNQLYKSIYTFLKAHPDISSEERATVCKSLNCLKLSQEMCIHAVQNEMMPLRMIVQAMFMQQLQTRNAVSFHLKSNSCSTNTSNGGASVANEEMQLQRILSSSSKKNGSSFEDDIEETNLRLEGLEIAMGRMRKTLRESTGELQLSYSRNCSYEQKKDTDAAVADHASPLSCSSCNQGSSKKEGGGRIKRIFLRKSSSSSSSGKSGIGRMFEKIGIFSLCKASSKNFSSFKDVESSGASGGASVNPMTNGCFLQREIVSSDDAYSSHTQHQHLRHHSIA